VTPRALLHVTQRLPARVEEALAERFDVRFGAKRRASMVGPAAASEIAVALREADAVLCTVTDAVTAECFEEGPVRARIIANFGVGVNHIALDAAKAAGITVTNTPDVLTDDTADLTIALMLAVMRRLGEGERRLRRGAWGGWHPRRSVSSGLGASGAPWRSARRQGSA
jgi:lactate dehydrogenase-like 2-hydroxyacid dehydrogenase